MGGRTPEDTRDSHPTRPRRPRDLGPSSPTSDDTLGDPKSEGAQVPRRGSQGRPGCRLSDPGPLSRLPPQGRGAIKPTYVPTETSESETDGHGKSHCELETRSQEDTLQSSPKGGKESPQSHNANPRHPSSPSPRPWTVTGTRGGDKEDGSGRYRGRPPSEGRVAEESQGPRSIRNRGMSRW